MQLILISNTYSKELQIVIFAANSDGKIPQRTPIELKLNFQVSWNGWILSKLSESSDFMYDFNWIHFEVNQDDYYC